MHSMLAKANFDLLHLSVTLPHNTDASFDDVAVDVGNDVGVGNGSCVCVLTDTI